MKVSFFNRVKFFLLGHQDTITLKIKRNPICYIENYETSTHSKNGENNLEVGISVVWISRKIWILVCIIVEYEQNHIRL
jgi:hypothetical protein